jgi:hypothetical protein
MEIKLSKSENKGRFFIEEEGKMLAQITWVKETEDHIILDHTFVDDSLRGQGIARQLFNKVIELAREREIKIQPVCSYAQKMFEQNPEIADLMYQ